MRKIVGRNLGIEENKLIKKAAMKTAACFLFGGAEGDRTPDLMAASHALSQLSYSPIKEWVDV